MPRRARIVAPDYPHHVTQRGNRRQQVFFSDDDYTKYVATLAEQCDRQKVAVWAWCLMPNHVHLILVPTDVTGLAAAVGETHKRYAARINRRNGWIGHLFQARFASCVMDETHCLLAARYVERNPDRAKLVDQPQDWPWSSARAHLGIGTDPLTDTSGMAQLVDDWQSYLNDPPPAWRIDQLRQHNRTGRPLMHPAALKRLEQQLDRRLAPKKRGRKPTSETVQES